MLDSVQRSHARTIPKARFIIDPYCYSLTPIWGRPIYVVWALLQLDMGPTGVSFVVQPWDVEPFLILGSHLIKIFSKSFGNFVNSSKNLKPL